jgi:hypothetical protein
MHDLVIADMIERKKIGQERYGTPLQSLNGRDARVDLQQELMDAIVYNRQAMEEWEELKAAIDDVMPDLIDATTCRCHDVYTSRRIHEPNAICHLHEGLVKVKELIGRMG